MNGRSGGHFDRLVTGTHLACCLLFAGVGRELGAGQPPPSTYDQNKRGERSKKRLSTTRMHGVKLGYFTRHVFSRKKSKRTYWENSSEIKRDKIR